MRRGQMISQLFRKKNNKRAEATEGQIYFDVNSLSIGGEKQQLHSRNNDVIKLNNLKY